MAKPPQPDDPRRASDTTSDSDTPSDNGSDSSDKAVRLLQGYIWHPHDVNVVLEEYLPKRLGNDIHLLWDAVTPPFTFFDDGTLAATQTIYQFTALLLADADTVQDTARFDPAGVVPWLAETLTEKLEQTPAGVGWQIMEDLREL